MMIEINQLVKRYDTLVALNHVDLQVAEGEILGLLGPNGSGKTTAIHCMLSLLRFDKGSIQLFGQKMTADNYAVKARIGIVPQEIAVFEELTVYENIDYFCGLYVPDKKKRQSLISEVVALVGLETFTSFYPHALSGGLKRRLNIACGIAHKPDLIFLDEPTVAVDPQSRNKILESIKALNQSGATIVYTTHYMEEVELLCDRIVIMDQGQVIAKGTKDELKDMVRTSDRLTIDIPFLPEEVHKKIKAQLSFEDMHYVDGVLSVTSTHLKDDLLPILTILQEANLTYGKISTKEATLNDVFLEITGKALRD
ncbi:ABC transporter ATP-binding protein [Enterococcus sp. RIT-PI-f]|uniref:ABC transporter ATP-binding protein n=1 Tax=Enterococcus sp. RIT-PI-f TaxID=1690244 RepID=UPI0006B9C85C|nr:ABC transporter ATP-binding protein [Enterococcus sp. RIT-PI-f]KPG69499.1 ABC transporter ATP-binding protein [Enterococcus sp. RIT-PI-f]